MKDTAEAFVFRLVARHLMTVSVKFTSISLIIRGVARLLKTVSVKDTVKALVIRGVSSHPVAICVNFRDRSCSGTWGVPS